MRKLMSDAVREYVPISSIYLAVLLATRYYYFGDTYVDNILAFYRGSYVPPQNPLWEFGHLLWRPLGWLLFRIFGRGLTEHYGGNARLAASLPLIVISALSGFITVLLVRSLATRFVK